MSTPIPSSAEVARMTPEQRAELKGWLAFESRISEEERKAAQKAREEFNARAQAEQSRADAAMSRCSQLSGINTQIASLEERERLIASTAPGDAS